MEQVLQAALSKLELATFDPRRKLLKLSTEKSITGVFLPLDDGQPDAPLRGIVIRSKGGPAIALSNIRLKERSSILGLDKAAFEKLGLPLRLADDNDPPKFPLLVPPAFGEHEKEKLGVERLIKLFPNVKYDPAVTPASPLDREADDLQKASLDAPLIALPATRPSGPAIAPDTGVSLLVGFDALRLPRDEGFRAGPFPHRGG